MKLVEKKEFLEEFLSFLADKTEREMNIWKLHARFRNFFLVVVYEMYEIDRKGGVFGSVFYIRKLHARFRNFFLVVVY